MNKKKYFKPSLQIIELKDNDIIATSGPATSMGLYNEPGTFSGAVGEEPDEWGTMW